MRTTQVGVMRCGRWTAFVLAGLIMWGVGGTDPDPREGSTMADEQLIGEIRDLNPDDQLALDALAEKARQQARGPLETVVRAWADPDVGLSENAAVLMDELDDLPLAPLLDAPDDLPPEKQMWLMRSVVVRERDLRERVEARLLESMEDTRPVPISETFGRAEERRPPERRVCDEAYMQLRLLLGVDESLDGYYLNVDAFLDTPEPERDAEVEKARTSREWTQFVGP
jgi:hypothetical protein